MMESDQFEFFEIFPWDKNFETGLEEVDEQHKKLVGILNQLAAHLANLAPEPVLLNIFQELAQYADYHFKTEEGIWKRFLDDDAWFIEHKSTHASFIDKVIALKNSADTKEVDEVVRDIVSFLSQWLANHILDDDKRLSKAALAMLEGESKEQAKIRANEEMSGSMRVLISTVLTMYDSLSTRTLDLMREKAMRRKAEHALSISEEQLKFITDSSDANLWYWDSKDDDQVLSIQEGSKLDIIGEELIAEEAACIHPPDNVYVQAQLQALLQGTTDTYNICYRISRKNGSWKWMHARGKVIDRDERGNILRLIGDRSDITERELTRLILQHGNQALVVTDNRNMIVGVNPAFTSITGYTTKEVIGRSLNFLSPGVQHGKSYHEIRAIFEAEDFWQGELWSQKKNGELFYESRSVISIRDGNGEVDHFVTILADITKRKRDEVKIEKYAETQATLFKEVNHRVKNNLMAIISMINYDVDRAEQQGTKEYKAHLNELVGRINGLATVHSLLSSNQWQPLLLTDLCKSVINGSTHIAHHKQHVTINVLPCTVTVNSDQAHYLAIVLNELSTNTIKHVLETNSEIVINVSVKEQNNSIELLYQDNGLGYPESVLKGKIAKLSIGINLITGIVKKSMRGSVEFTNDNGASARVIFPQTTFVLE